MLVETILKIRNRLT